VGLTLGLGLARHGIRSLDEHSHAVIVLRATLDVLNCYGVAKWDAVTPFA